MLDLINKLANAIANEADRRQRSIEALAMAIALAAVAPFVPPILGKRVDETTDDDLNGLSLADLQTWDEQVKAYAEAQQSQGGG